MNKRIKNKLAKKASYTEKSKANHYLPGTHPQVLRSSQRMSRAIVKAMGKGIKVTRPESVPWHREFAKKPIEWTPMYYRFYRRKR